MSNWFSFHKCFDWFESRLLTTFFIGLLGELLFVGYVVASALLCYSADTQDIENEFHTYMLNVLVWRHESIWYYVAVIVVRTISFVVVVTIRLWVVFPVFDHSDDEFLSKIDYVDDLAHELESFTHEKTVKKPDVISFAWVHIGGCCLELVYLILLLVLMINQVKLPGSAV